MEKEKSCSCEAQNNPEEEELILNLVFLGIGSVLLAVAFTFAKLDPTFTEISWSCFQNSSFYHSRAFVAFLLYTVDYAFLLFVLLKPAIEEIKEGNILNETTLMLVATLGAYGICEFPESVLVILLSILGEILEDKAKEKSSKSIKKLVNSMPLYAHIVNPDGTIKEGNPEEVCQGDILEIRPGEKVPVDGVVLSGSSSLDLSSINGESLPKDIQEGESIYSGSINLSSVLRIKAVKDYQNSTLSKIMLLVETEQSKKAKSERFITRFAKIYTPIVILTAIAVFLIGYGVSGWVWEGNNGGASWLYKACSILLISCPCALVISVPIAFFSGIGAASKLGILIKGSLAMENLSKSNVFVFDKTGTLTKGNFALINKPKEENLKIAASLESKSSHPLAVAIVSAYQGETIEPEAFENLPGYGIKGTINGETYLIGGTNFLEKEGISFQKEDTPFKVLYLASEAEKKVLDVFIVADELKPQTKEAVSALKNDEKVKTIMLSGDDKAIAEKMGKEIGLDEATGGLLPEHKLNRINELKKDSFVCYVGDGINDSPSLLASHVGISMGALGSDAAIEASNIVIMDDNLLKVAEAKRLSEHTMTIVKECIFLSLIIKLVVMVLVITGVLGDYGMIVASLSDTGMMALAVLNAVRALKYKPKYLK